MNEEVLNKIRQFVIARVEHSVTETGIAWVRDVADLLPLYLQFQILDKLQSIDDTLISLDGMSWKDHHDK